MSRDLPVVRGENAIIEAEGDLLSTALAVANKGQRLIYERMDKMADQQLVQATQMAGRVISTKRRWQYASTGGDGVGITALAKLIESLPPGGTVTVAREAPKAGEDAIDVSPASSDSLP